MQTHFHHYSGYIQAVEIGAWLMTFFIVAIVTLIVVLKPLALIENPLEALSYLLPLLISAGFTAYMANMRPSLGANEDGILVRFLWHYIRVPWEQVTEIKRLSTDYNLSPVWLIRTSKLTAFHRLYGFPHPGFYIYASISNYHELMQEIERHLNVMSLK
jgi:hypothetical protein